MKRLIFRVLMLLSAVMIVIVFGRIQGIKTIDFARLIKFEFQDKRPAAFPKPQQGMRITSPVGPVGAEEVAIKGTTPYLDRNHYIVVTAPTRDKFVEDGPLMVSGWGAWGGHARFGNASAGRGQFYVVQVMATRASLSTGPMTGTPSDAVYSNPVMVERRQ